MFPKFSTSAIKSLVGSKNEEILVSFLLPFCAKEKPPIWRLLSRNDRRTPLCRGDNVLSCSKANYFNSFF